MILFALLLVSAVVLGAVADSLVAPGPPPAGGSILEWLSWGIGIAIFLYEVIIRIVPTLTNNSIFHMIGVILDWIVKIFNGVGNKAKLPDGTTGAFKSVPTRV